MKRKPNKLEVLLEGPLRRIFVLDKNEELVFDGKPGRSQLLSDSIIYGVDNGLLYAAKTTYGRGGTMRIAYRLSKKGKKHFAIG